MLVRFNKSPWHRRVRELSDQEAQRGVVNIPTYDSKFSKGRFFDLHPNTQVMIAPKPKIATYRVKMVKVNLRGQDEWVPSVFPDSAVCFELERIDTWHLPYSRLFRAG